MAPKPNDLAGLRDEAGPKARPILTLESKCDSQRNQQNDSSTYECAAPNQSAIRAGTIMLAGRSGKSPRPMRTIVQ